MTNMTKFAVAALAAFALTAATAQIGEAKRYRIKTTCETKSFDIKPPRWAWDCCAWTACFSAQVAGCMRVDGADLEYCAERASETCCNKHPDCPGCSK